MPFTPGQTDTDDGGTGTSTTGRGLVGESTDQAGVVGTSQNFVGVWGESQSPASAGQPGVFGTSANWQGVHGESVAQVGVFGTSQNFVGVWGESQSPASAGQPGVFGTSANWQGVHGESVAQVGVFGTSQNFVGVWGESQSDTQPGVYGTGPVIAASFQGKLLVNGSGSFTGDVEVTGDVLVGGGDCAEDFAVVEGAADFGPGTVMILTEGGALQPSQDAYDKKVAGVVSGAGDARPGLILGKEHSSENHMPLALVGSVYCKADAQYGPIEVGDLLTTSPTAGHAMRAADPLKAFGAVIGKALQSLSSGQGLVRILVALQ